MATTTVYAPLKPIKAFLAQNQGIYSLNSMFLPLISRKKFPKKQEGKCNGVPPLKNIKFFHFFKFLTCLQGKNKRENAGDDMQSKGAFPYVFFSFSKMNISFSLRCCKYVFQVFLSHFPYGIRSMFFKSFKNTLFNFPYGPSKYVF